MGIRAGDLQRDARCVELSLEFRDGLADGGAGVFIQSRVNMWGACGNGDSVTNSNSGHGQGGGDIRNAVIDAG